MIFPRYPQLTIDYKYRQALILLICEAHLSNGEGQEKVSTQSVWIKGEAVVNQCCGEPQVVADQSFLP